ncbi:MAG: TlpA family protein disulfide reductase [Candidatus Cloacimonetes bacterium]|nr:TlpA family protein disulfide reductase [Candidatus Cloacimonadota bacterium]MCF7814583.1 TlpA family protein disulfide reductase [Candidatus Cloacimonadota bacterium]MCF7869096.1 TlpA family protein disulfide reductase [Candidatus Cloacimonadota bacterium]MCF7884513.1 TlpA family protein disulfide reductase [Candidatus Cloacimonadota bacterium]
MKKILLSIIVLSVAFVLMADDQAVEFKLENIKGKMVKLSDLQKDGLVIIDFWATWCVPCKNALPKLNELHNKYDNVTVVAISTDKPRKKDKAVSHIKSNRFNFVTLFDPTKTVQKQFNVTNIPRTLMIDPEGNIIYDHTGFQRGDEVEYEEVIQSWLEDQAAKEQLQE